MNFSDYYQSYNNYFWLWEEDAEVLAIAGGSTIAFREQAAELLTGLAEEGLPPFGSFLLAMIATNKTIDDSLGFIQDKLAGYLASQQKITIANEEIIDNAFTFLRILQQIPQEYKIGKRRQILLQTIFAMAHNKFNAGTSKGIAVVLKDQVKGRSRLQQQKEFNDNVFIKDFRVIGLLIRRFPDAQAVMDAMGELPELEEGEMPLLETVTASDASYKDFVEELMDKPQTFQSAVLIKPIWAGFKVPIFNAHPSEQPLGGVSDLSNKGDFDKLLVSEFANDDIVFMSRIANNEALYLHREMPPVKDKLERTILIDISLKCWGTPKIVAYAAYLAIARHPKALSKSSAFVVGNNYVAVSCNEVGEIIDGLQKVDAGLHAGKGLAAFLEDNKHNKQLEIFYITTADALKFPDVQKQLAAYHTLFKYTITTSAEGEINFYRNKNNAQKHLQTIRLPLEKLWANKQVKLQEQTIISKTANPKSFVPLLLCTPHPIRKLIPLDDELYCVANRCLLRRSTAHSGKENKGWELLLRNVAANSLYEAGKLANGELVFLVFNLQSKALSITNITTRQTATTLFKAWNGKMYREFLFNKYYEFMYLITNPDAFAFVPNFETGIIAIEKAHLTSNIFGKDYPGRQQQIKDLPYIFSNTKILKNLREVYINRENYLVFNTHQLHIGHSNQLIFSSYDFNKEKAAIATPVHNKKEFVFKEGSKVLIDPCGFITLVSSNSAIPEIFLSASLDIFFGAATANEFAGHEFFYNDRLAQVSVILNSVGSQALNAVKIVYSGLGLKDAKEIIDAAPKLISDKILLTDAKKMVEALTDCGCQAVIEKPQHPLQSIIATNTFYQQNIAKFIGHIINYAAAD
ncbi:MAG: ribosomal protein L7/L12 [Ferruginibacter sp.]